MSRHAATKIESAGHRACLTVILRALHIDMHEAPTQVLALKGALSPGKFVAGLVQLLPN